MVRHPGCISGVAIFLGGVLDPPNATGTLFLGGVAAQQITQGASL
ncbi:MAG: hypothetical protein AAF572_06830 [Cyanobacteria bacterium P01_B01_bin.77]